ncbi:uncharacterized protein LOC144754318 isoform X2 [Lissotriton helveticus]
MGLTESLMGESSIFWGQTWRKYVVRRWPWSLHVSNARIGQRSFSIRFQFLDEEEVGIEDVVLDRKNVLQVSLGLSSIQKSFEMVYSSKNEGQLGDSQFSAILLGYFTETYGHSNFSRH